MVAGLPLPCLGQLKASISLAAHAGHLQIAVWLSSISLQPTQGIYKSLSGSQQSKGAKLSPLLGK